MILKVLFKHDSLIMNNSLIRTLGISLVTVSLALLALNTIPFHAFAQQGGSATSGPVTGGSATGSNTTGGSASSGAVTGGSANGEGAIGGNATGGPVMGGNATSGHSPSNGSTDNQKSPFS